MLNLYTDKTFLTDTYRKNVFPLLFDLHFVKNDTLFDYYNLVDVIEEADIVVFPIDYNSFYSCKVAFKRLNNLAKKHNKPIWLYTAGDFGFTVHIPNSYNFRLGGFDSKLNDNTFILPSFINDPLKTVLNKSFSALSKEPKPSIGFVGHAQSGFIKYLKSYLNHLKTNFKRTFKSGYFDKQEFYPSGIKRAYYLNKLRQNNNLNTNFIFRDKYRAGAINQKSKVETTQEFYDNINDNLYTFCIRGVGNFSVRFYETLAVGRIPVLLNTDCRLPLSNVINWKKHVVFLDDTKQENIEQQLLSFHESKNNAEIESIQVNNRKLWETSLMRHTYFIQVHDLLINKATETHD